MLPLKYHQYSNSYNTRIDRIYNYKEFENQMSTLSDCPSSIFNFSHKKMFSWVDLEILGLMVVAGEQSKLRKS